MNDCVGPEVEAACKASTGGEIIMLENVRFHLEEEGKGIVNGEKVKASKDDIKTFRKSLTSLGDIYVNDAFGTSHWAHSSMVGVEVETRVAGFLLKKELEYFSKILENPDWPLTMVLGGAKVADKIKLIMNMINIANEIIIGGGMAFTFNKVHNGTKIGNSLFDEEGAKLVSEIYKKAEEKGVKIHIPSDFICSDKLDGSGKIVARTEVEGIEDGFLGLDIGVNTRKAFTDVLKRSRTVFWNGPQGVFEQ